MGVDECIYKLHDCPFPAIQPLEAQCSSIKHSQEDRLPNVEPNQLSNIRSTFQGVLRFDVDGSVGMSWDGA